MRGKGGEGGCDRGSKEERSWETFLELCQLSDHGLKHWSIDCLITVWNTDQLIVWSRSETLINDDWLITVWHTDQWLTDHCLTHWSTYPPEHTGCCSNEEHTNDDGNSNCVPRHRCPVRYLRGSGRDHTHLWLCVCVCVWEENSITKTIKLSLWWGYVYSWSY